ncbi:hypothetical protein LCGC14_2103230 [marine sediment metagenome]|uniref:Phosphoadenosine phosphosulphate reductase domain-containing protein n=1 Tax=marine sediment metagenome TaxID=412755 RepID=A0A0F9EWG0_9ZZZZ
MTSVDLQYRVHYDAVCTDSNRRIVCWFSCGAASAAAAYLILKKRRKNVVVVYCDTLSDEHTDNARFLLEVQDWLGVSVLREKSEKYADRWDVYEKTRYLVGVKGAQCTVALKKVVRNKFALPGDINVFGYTSEERIRIERLLSSGSEVNACFPLDDLSIKKGETLALLQSAKIELPAMYQLRYRNNNCLGCVKGGQGYWNKIRKDFPQQFDRMARMERDLGVAINKKESDGRQVRTRTRLFLDELDPLAGRYKSEPDISCGVLCQ